MQFKPKSWVKFLWVLAAILIITLAIVSSIFRALTPWASQYKHEIEQHLTLLFNEPVTIQRMETGWYWFNPVVKLQDVVIKQGNDSAIELKNLLIGVNLFSSLRHWQIQPGILYLDDLHLTLYQDNNQWRIKGFKPFNTGAMQWNALTLSPLLKWIFSQEKIIIKNLSADVQLQNKETLLFKALNLSIEKHQGIYYLEGKTYLEQSLKTQFLVQGNLAFNASNPLKSQFHAFVSVNNLQLAQWQSFLSPLPGKLTKGLLSTAMWLDWEKGRLKKIQGYANASNIHWQETLQGKKERIIEFKTNFLGNQTKTEWQIEFDKLLFTLDKKFWPENQLSLRYEQETEQYKFFVRTLNLPASLKEITRYYPTLNPYAAALTQGYFSNLQFYLKDKKIVYCLVQFTNLSWKAHEKIPSVQNLAGVLQWEPAAGRLDLDSKNTAVLIKNKPPIVIPELNLSLEWKQLSQGLRVSIERLIINHPELLVNVNAVMDEVGLKSLGQVQVSAQVSASHIERWLTYIPSQVLKPKLEFWLKHNLKKIPHGVADITVNGYAPDFPFDNSRGEFAIRGYIDGASILFAPEWPLTQDLDAYINVDKRALNINIGKANLQGIEVKDVPIVIKNLGLGREVLLSHSIIEGSARKALSYILHSPLQKKLSALSILQFYGDILLDLQIEIPLYPENNEVLVLGEVKFKDNKLLVKSNLNNLALTKLQGAFNFEQDGIKPSSLTAQFFNHPLNLEVQSVAAQKPYTEIKMRTLTVFSDLQHLFHLPNLPMINGQFNLEGLLTVTDDINDLDNLRFSSLLKGLAINLPPPFGKPAESEAPFSLVINFNPNQLVKMHTEYNQQFASDITFSAKNGVLNFENGQINLGKPSVNIDTARAGLQINGTLADFDLDQWKKLANDFIPKKSKNSHFDSLNYGNLLIKKLHLGGQTYQDLLLKFEKKTNYWAILVHQQLVKGALNYYPFENKLQGSLKQLTLPESLHFDNKQNTLNPNELPTINLRIEDFSTGDLKLGKLTVNGVAHKDRWILEELSLFAPFYRIQASGVWTKTAHEDSTRVNGIGEITDLAKILQQMNKIPVVEAKKGKIKFNTSWPGSFSRFSLKTLAGKAALVLKEGRITHLDKETEEKIGMGKLLSILSLQTIPRRLKLDFTDLSQNGYSFDEFKGNFAFNNGLMSTLDSYLNGPIAYITIQGQLNLVKQLYNLDLEIYPHITASLPVVATIAGGPIAGLATWVASQLISHGVQKINGYSYKISGPWKQPLVQQINFIQKK